MKTKRQKRIDALRRLEKTLEGFTDSRQPMWLIERKNQRRIYIEGEIAKLRILIEDDTTI